MKIHITIYVYIYIWIVTRFTIVSDSFIEFLMSTCIVFNEHCDNNQSRGFLSLLTWCIVIEMWKSWCIFIIIAEI